MSDMTCRKQYNARLKKALWWHSRGRTKLIWWTWMQNLEQSKRLSGAAQT